MSTRFWIFCAGSIGIAAALGFGLGGYAAGEGPIGWQTAPVVGMPPDPVADPPAVPYAAPAGPAVIRCKGCGPTLAERRMAADMARLDDARDPIVADYMAREEGTADPVPAPPAELMPAQTPALTSDSGGTPPRAAPPPVRATMPSATAPMTAMQP